jgi:arylsulfatase A-like enzyme
MGLRNDTAIVVCSDHGEAFGEHGRFGHYPHLYDELIRVPLIVNTPDMGSKISQTPVSLIDIAPTLFDLIDIPTPGKVQGKSLLDLVDQDEERVTISACSGDTVSKNVSEWEYFATRTANWKCFWRRDIDRVELYDLTKDPGELKDVSHEYPDTVNYFRELMEEHLNEAVETELTLPEVEKSENVKQRLRDLGYTE